MKTICCYKNNCPLQNEEKQKTIEKCHNKLNGCTLSVTILDFGLAYVDAGVFFSKR